MVKFSAANTKLKKLYKVESLKKWLTGKRKIYSFDLLSGWSCPAANACKSKVIIDENGKRKIQDGPETQFRCFSASQEALYPNVYNLRKANFDALINAQTGKAIKDLIQAAFPKNAGIVRIHVAGDFFSKAYMWAWLQIAIENPHILFYAYTKQIPFLLELQSMGIPDNLVFTASYGGRHDDLISIHNLRTAVVVENEIQASSLELEVDDDDSHAADPEKRNQSFALVIHGTQPKIKKKITLPVLS
jgi:hypothetical protein